ncbi:MAG: hypothetical protein RLZZ592_2553 [Pseudomonadota bacterium]|nr:hypothetical protein [Pseudomonadota bacterium]
MTPPSPPASDVPTIHATQEPGPSTGSRPAGPASGSLPEPDWTDEAPPGGWQVLRRRVDRLSGGSLLAALHPARWGLLVLALIVSGLWLVELANRGAAHDTLPMLSQASVRMLPDAERPQGDAPHLVTLPHDWTQPPRAATPLQYTLQLDLPRPPAAGQDPLLGLYIERVCAAYEIRVNGWRLAARGDLKAPRPHDCLDPVLIALPPSMLRAGSNPIDIVVAAQVRAQVAVSAHAGHLSPIRVAPMRDLEGLQRRLHTLNTSATQALAVLVGVAGMAALVLAALNRLPYLGYFGAACLGWALLCALLTGARLPLSVVAHEWLAGALMPPVAVAAILSLMRCSGLQIRWIELSVALQSVVVPLSLLIAAPDRISTITQPWVVILSLEVLATLAVFMHHAWRRSPADFRIVGVALGVALLAAAAEHLLVPEDTLLTGVRAVSLGVGVMFAGMVLRMHQQLQASVRRAEEGRLAAERRVEEITVDMERNYSHMAEMRVEQVTAKERKRIAADLHDDLGAKLLTIVHTSESERIATLAREALEEMRLSVRGLTGRAVQLGDAIGDWRSEVMMRLSQGGVELNWNTPDELLMSERAMSARAYVQTTRILREAVSNVLKHSGATHCEISMRMDINDFELTISDNGRGIPMELDGKLDRGHGMSTMKGRAKQLQGQCLVESGPGYGTTIRLTLPL